MVLIKKIVCVFSVILTSQWAFSAYADEYFIETKDAYYAIQNDLKAGDTVILKNGIWQDFEILFSGQGSAEAPIRLTAEKAGQVIISGESNLRLAGRYLEVNGLVFKDGYTPTSSVIEFRKDDTELAFHSRVTQTVIDNFNNPDKTESDYWVALYGQHNRFDHNHVVGKRNRGVTVAVRLNTAESQQNQHRIDHNYFGYRPTFGSNGGETLRIGTSHHSLTDSLTVVENNYFEQTNGEVEIISVKSGKNIIRGNVFFEAQGTLTMRHGNGNLIEENIFIGNKVPHTGGIRVINKDQVIRNNYLEGLTGYRFGSGFTVMNGVPNSRINRYHQVENATITNNTLIDVEHIQLAAGSDSERSAVPINSKMSENLIINRTTKQPFTLFDDVSGIKFTDNVMNQAPLSELEYGIKQQDVSLVRASNGLLYPKDKSLKYGAKRDLPVLDKSATGVAWYPKVPAVVAFASGETHNITSSPEVLLNAIAAAKSGDVIAIAAGAMTVPRVLFIDKVLTIKAQQPGTVKLGFEKSTLFEILDGGSLALDGLEVSGDKSPDSYGNSVIRTKKWGMIDNYRLRVTNSRFVDLNINHSFHFFITGKGAFADEITLQGNTFKAVSGDILQLDSEIEDLGIYNAEYVNIQNNAFADVSGAVIKLYRGGTDESTFGPHLLVTENTLNNVGKGKRNKTRASLFIHGVQVTDVKQNDFADTQVVVVEHTVGEPQTKITQNTYNTAPFVSVEELRFPGPHTAVLENNKQIK
jgi:poly(beta-D-mannuronate) lyase